MAVRFAIAVSLGVSLFAADAGAQSLERGALRLEWSAPGGCPNGVEVVERIEALLGGPIANLRPDPIAAKGTVRQLEPLRFELELETVQHAQRFARSMQAPSCAELADAGALVLALAIDPTLAERQAHKKESAKEDVALPPALAPAPPPAQPKPAGLIRNLDSPNADEPPNVDEPPDDEERSGPEWAARLGLVLDLGTVGDLGYGPTVTGAAGFGRVRAELGLVWLFPTQTSIASDPERGGAIDLVAADVAGCFRPFQGETEIQGCADLELGRIHGAGYGTVVESEQSAFWFGMGAHAAGRIRTTEGLFLAVHAGFLYHPQDTEFTLENVGVVHVVPPFVGRFGLAIESEFE